MVEITIDILLLVDSFEVFKMKGRKIEIPIINPMVNKCSNPNISNSSASNI
ncbi:hypothetical protein OA512_04075 [SAR86 cluster bacterium]|nr:hypothetical protein [SAR86 cluster bacterium]